MQFHLFQYPIPTDSDLSDLNGFLAAHRIVSVSRDIVNSSTGPVLLFTVEVASSSRAQDKSRSKKIDYRVVLSVEEFALFSQLREERKRIADGEGVPVFSLFNNAQLAEMVTTKVTDLESLIAIRGVGEARGSKYGKAMLEILQQLS